MKLMCRDNIERSFVSIKDALISIGFDSKLLESDDNFIMLGGSPDGCLRDILKIIRGSAIQNYYHHYSRKSRQLNNSSVTLQKILKPGMWVAIDPSIKLLYDSDFNINASLEVKLARSLTKIYRKYNNNHEVKSVFEGLLIGRKCDSFEFFTGYEVAFLGRPEFDVALDYIYVNDMAESGFLLHPTIMGYTTKILISYD